MRVSLWATIALTVALPCMQAQAADSASDGAAAQAALVRTVTDLDTRFFAAFNTCDAPGQLDRHAAFLDPKLEFYHDTGGVSWTSKDYLDKTRQNVCGTYRRKLVGSLDIYPIKDYGALEEGNQAFCDTKTGECFGAAKFMILWHRTADGWLATRIFSYGHHALK
ncbi:MAG: hypothetical protein GAK28_00526 [Luteibacter sp.]|uniref:nuclear transport factor 2 family protein n=1 Tax=Luteibacter sp. TaxID=1886636 RepID=UPI00137E53E8|nr:nuclear transport factor 2 family protein [Luteibacter sp.]KAF1008894.1 MAG: hypothetical protein GAK28_00526 [Luteibacter sp.]